MKIAPEDRARLMLHRVRFSVSVRAGVPHRVMSYSFRVTSPPRRK